MKMLVTEDDAVTRTMLQNALTQWGYNVTPTCNGVEAWKVLQKNDTPSLLLLDWMMPDMDGVELCHNIRKQMALAPIYIVLLTCKGAQNDVVRGLEAGADDYVRKPFDPDELHARLQVGERVLNMQQTLSDHAKQLEEALANVKQLQGLIPICGFCKKVRDDQNFWNQVEVYMARHSDARFSHGICPECLEKNFPEANCRFKEK